MVKVCVSLRNKRKTIISNQLIPFTNCKRTDNISLFGNINRKFDAIDKVGAK